MNKIKENIIIELRKKGVILTALSPAHLVEKHIKDFPELQKHLENGKGTDKFGTGKKGKDS